MIVKVNRVKTGEEIELLKELKVDIIGITIDRLYKDDPRTLFDSRALSLEEALELREQIRPAELAVFINHYAEDEAFQQILDHLKPEYLNLYLPFSTDQTNKKWFLSQTQKANETKIPVITFGDGIGYDSPFRFTPEDLKILNHLSFIEMNVDTLNKKKNHSIKPGKGRNIRQDEVSDLVYETVQSHFGKMNVLLDDQLEAADFREEITHCKAKGITFSLVSLEKDMWTGKSDGSFFSTITVNTCTLNEIREYLSN